MENLTLGQKRVQRSFNPSANPKVEELKESYAQIIDKIESLRNEKKRKGDFNCSNRSRNILHVCR